MKRDARRPAVAVLAALMLCGTAVLAEDTEPAAPEDDSTRTTPVVRAEITEAVVVEGKKEKPPIGWKEVRRRGVLYWCRKSPPTGSRVRNELECATPTQFKARQESDRKQAEELIRNAPGPKGG